MAAVGAAINTHWKRHFIPIYILCEGQWIDVVRKKPRAKPKPKVIVGKGTDTSVKCITRSRNGILFLSRCYVENKVEDIVNLINSTISDYDIKSVEPWKAKYDTYCSFKICFELGDKKLKEFFKETITADRWPNGLLVMPFGLKNLNIPSQSS